jgi:hypothetical protein
MEPTEKPKFPTEIINLPSKGLLYPKDNILSQGKIEMMYMTARHEDILTNENYLKQGIAIDKLLQALIVDKIDLDSLLLCDKNALIIASRILGYGEEYNVPFYNPLTKENDNITVNLSKLKERELDVNKIITEGVNEFEFITPTTNTKLTFKLLTHGDEMRIEEEMKGLKKLFPQNSYEVTTQLKHTILSVNGSRNPKDVRDYIDNYLVAKDSNAFRKYVQELSPEIELKFDYDKNGYTKEGIPFRIGLDFFWPK